MAEQECIVCPVDNCDWSGAESLLQPHFKESHQEIHIRDGRVCSFGISKRSGTIQCLFCFNKKNIFLKVLSRALSESETDFIIPLQLIGAKKSASNYEYCIETFDNNDKSTKKFPWQPVHSPPFHSTCYRNKSVIIKSCKLTFRYLESKTSHLEKFSRNIVHNLRCPQCFETMHTPIHQCGNGHLLCDDCKSKLHKCPTCANATLSRNLFAEDTAATRICHCKYKSMGCNFIATKKVVDTHSCMYNEDMGCFDEDCDWKGTVEDLYGHAKEVHEEMVMERGASMPLENYYGAVTEYRFILNHNGVIFVVMIVLKKVTLYFTVKVLGPNVYDYCYKYTLTIASEGNDNVFKTTKRCVDYVSEEEHVESRIECPLKMMYNFVDEDENLNFTVDISFVI